MTYCITIANMRMIQHGNALVFVALSYATAALSYRWHVSQSVPVTMGGGVS